MSFEARAGQMPGFLKFLMVASAGMGAIGAILSALFLSATAVVPGPYMVNGRRVSFEEFMAFALPVLGGYFVMSVLALAVSWGLRHERLWARPLLVGITVASALVPLAAAFLTGVSFRGTLFPMIVCLVMLVVFWWQLYYDDDIVAYYAALREEQRG
jgi:hypothetical protein